MRKARRQRAATRRRRRRLEGRGRRDQHRIFDETTASGKLGQSMNVAGISLFLKLAVSDASLAVPHVDCESIQDIDWFVEKAGFTAVILDKDNTLTIPSRRTCIRRC